MKRLGALFLPLAACGDSSMTTPPTHPGPTDGGADADAAPLDGGSTPSHVKTIFLILMENHNWSSIKNSASAPYINNTLLPMAARAESYFDNPKKIHPSEPNYVWLEAADNLAITNDADPSASHFIVGKDHLTEQLKAAGVSWHAYEEDMTKGQCPIASNGSSMTSSAIRPRSIRPSV